MPLGQERLYSLTEIADGKLGVPLERSRQTWLRYCVLGSLIRQHAEEPSYVRLESIRIGGRHHTSLEAIKRFVSALKEAGA